MWKNFSTWQIFSPQALLVVLVTNIRFGQSLLEFWAWLSNLKKCNVRYCYDRKVAYCSAVLNNSVHYDSNQYICIAWLESAVQVLDWGTFHWYQAKRYCYFKGSQNSLYQCTQPCCVATSLKSLKCTWWWRYGSKWLASGPLPLQCQY